jgi:hypothetical protein
LASQFELTSYPAVRQECEVTVLPPVQFVKVTAANVTTRPATILLGSINIHLLVPADVPPTIAVPGGVKRRAPILPELRERRWRAAIRLKSTLIQYNRG